MRRVREISCCAFTKQCGVIQLVSATVLHVRNTSCDVRIHVNACLKQEGFGSLLPISTMPCLFFKQDSSKFNLFLE